MRSPCTARKAQSSQKQINKILKINNQDGGEKKKSQGLERVLRVLVGEKKGIGGWTESESMSQSVVMDQNQS